MSLRSRGPSDEKVLAGQEDAVLITACLAGNPLAWNALVHRYKRLVYSIPIKWGLAHEDAVDIFQAVWLDCFEQLSSLRDLERLKPWLARMAVRKCHRFTETRGKRAMDALPEEDLLPSDAPSIDALLEQLDREQALRAAMDQLGDRCRQVLQGLFFEDPSPSYVSIAERLHLPLNSVGSLRDRCLNNLKSALLEVGFQP